MLVLFCSISHFKRRKKKQRAFNKIYSFVAVYHNLILYFYWLLEQAKFLKIRYVGDIEIEIKAFLIIQILNIKVFKL